MKMFQYTFEKTSLFLITTRFYLMVETDLAVSLTNRLGGCTNFLIAVALFSIHNLFKVG